jgi:phosphate:Na+ symporter
MDVRMLSTPSLGIAQSKKEIQMMAQGVEKMLERLGEALATDEPDEANERKIFQREEILDNIQREVTVFLGQLVAGSVSHETSVETHRQLRMADEYESLSDAIVSVLKMYIKLRHSELNLSEEGRGELLDLHEHVVAYVDMVSRAVAEEQRDILPKAASDGDRITNIMKDYRTRHLARLAREEVTPLKSLIFTDMLAAYRRMKDHALNIAEALAAETYG